jgi:hypothetical protein
MSAWIARAGRGRLPALALSAAALAALSCSTVKIPTPPEDGIEGQPSASQLIVYPDTPTLIYTYADTLPPGPSPNDRLLSVEEVYAAGPGVVHGMIFDFTDAERFEVFRREGNAFRRLKDFDLYPAKRVLHGGTEIYRFTDPRPGPAGAREYLGRGVVAGVVTTQSPKTNLSRLQIDAVSPNLDYTGPTGIAPDFRPMTDSLLYLEWAPYPGAAGYWVHVYQFTDQGGDEVIASTIPAPMYVDVTRDYFLAYFPANVTAYRMGQPAPPGVRIVTQPSPLSPRDILNGLIYNVRVSAVDANGQLIAYTGQEAQVVFRSEETYRVFSLGAAQLQPRPCGALPLPPCPCGDPPLPPCSSSGAPAPLSRIQIYPAGTFPGPAR